MDDARRRSQTVSLVFIILLATAAFATVAVHGVIEYRSTKIIVGQFAEARQDSDTIIALDQTLDDAIDAETAVRGFLLTGQQPYLDPYEHGVEKINADLATVERLTSAEPAQKVRLRELRSAISAKFAELSETLRLYEHDGSKAAFAAVNSGRGREIMHSIRRTIGTMRTTENQERMAARTQADISSERVLEGIEISTSVAAILLLLTFVQFAIAARANQRAREQSESANRIKDQFLATVSHELRTPLTAILGWSSILRGEQVDPGILKEGLTTIQRSASVQKNLIEDMLDVSRIQSGKLRLSMRTLDLTDAVRGAIESMRPAADAKSIAIITEIESSIRISGDPDRLQQIVWNLMTNAVKFTPRGGKITVTVSRIDSHALVEVRDSGEGIDPSFMPRVFEPFQQSDSSRARIHKGLGLGLSIVKYLVEAHGGTVSARSAGKGEGTTFRVSLPIMPIVHGEMSDEEPLTLASDAAEVSLALPSPDALRGLSVLIVDDHAPTLEIVSYVLGKAGAIVFSASNATEAMTLFRAHRPSVVVSDIGMPGEDGLSLLEHIRQLPQSEGRDTPAIALTAYIRKEDSERLLAGGFQSYLTKPVEPAELVNAIARIGDPHTAAL
jgi:signal transduction histidine kinase/ActR/RegA family two-component response regulator